jgi:lysophospholipase L1-like esterase
MKTIVFIGDSITEGADDHEHGGWTRRVQARLPEGWQAVHAGIGGNVITDVLARMDRDVLAHKPSIVVLAIGINDSRQFTFENRRNGVALPEFKASLTEYAKRVNELAGPKLIVGLTPVDETRTNSFEAGMIYASAAQREYDEALQAFAAEHDYTYIAIEPAFDANGGAQALTTDGLHPNPVGHELIALAVWANLEPLVN